ncbi:MAG: barstar family protein [Methylovirgula sp.]
MKVIELDAEKWSTIIDFDDALAARLGSPKYVGYSLDSQLDAMIWGGLNAVEPPYTIRILNVRCLPKDVLDYIELLKHELAEERVYFNRQEGHDVEVLVELVP